MQFDNKKNLIIYQGAVLAAITKTQSTKRGLVARGLEEIEGLYKPPVETADAQCTLGKNYSDIFDRKQAVYWFKKAAEQGHLEAQYWLGWLYIREVDELFDVKLGLQYFKSSAEAGYVESMVWLARHYMYGSPPLEKKDKDYKQAFYWFCKAAEHNHAVAQRRLGYMYQEGLGATKDDGQAAIWYQKSAEQGDAKAQCELGWIYQSGTGVAQNDKLALSWYLKSAKQGYVHAQGALGTLYELGECVPSVDHKKAIKWYRKAAQQGDLQSKEALADLERRIKIYNL
jgi:uncharacterized protein